MGEAVPDRAEPVIDIISDEEEEEDPEEREPATPEEEDSSLRSDARRNQSLSQIVAVVRCVRLLV